MWHAVTDDSIVVLVLIVVSVVMIVDLLVTSVVVDVVSGDVAFDVTRYDDVFVDFFFAVVAVPEETLLVNDVTLVLDVSDVVVTSAVLQSSLLSTLYSSFCNAKQVETTQI